MVMADLEAGGTASVPAAPAPASPPGSPASADHSLMSGDIPASSSTGEMSSAPDADGNAHADAQHLSAGAVSESSSPPPPHTPKSSPSKMVMKTVRTVLPKAEPLPWRTFFSLSFKVAIP